MTFNPNHVGEIKGTGAPIQDPDKIKNTFRVMDANLISEHGTRSPEWRSFDARRVIKIKVNGQCVEFNNQ